MAAVDLENQFPCRNVEISVHDEDKLVAGGCDQHFHRSHRGQWLRAAISGANDGLVSVASLMIGVGAAGRDVMAMALAGFAGLVAGSCSVAVGEFVYIHSQMREEDMTKMNVGLPNPFQAAIVSALTFVVGAMVPVMAAAVAAAVAREQKVRIGVVVVVGVSSLGFLVFGGVGAVLAPAGRTPAGWWCAVRVVVGGWMAMAVTAALTLLLCSTQY